MPELKLGIKHIIQLIVLIIVISIVVLFFVVLRPLFFSSISEKQAEAIAIKYAAGEYNEDVIIDRVFLHGGFLSYLIDGHFQNEHQTSFRMLVDDDSGRVSDFEFSKDYANMQMLELNNTYADELIAKGYEVPERYVSSYGDAFFVAYSCAESKSCDIHELQVRLPDGSSQDEIGAFGDLYRWQKTLPVRIDSIYVDSPEGEGVSRCLRPDASIGNPDHGQSDQYAWMDFIEQGKCTNRGDK
ncbi:hypothetical protein J2W91_001793 [Paenibacillus amylolyticus]|uniref:Uncharacterized protein n=1 Tax=Paenibacillus amylolyticus TaxID=1451 RepID=A0AAP5H1P9_PAEAM|nr:hypothetical protein [Paenibacillus amylolyticus]MDR6723341.1 hypothetical protein [Paenibacillus amylolyticus]